MNVTVFPGGSKTKVNQAGNNIRNRCHTPKDIQIIDEWRASHRPVLNTFQAILRQRTRKTKIIVAQRHKRKSTIFGKLDRFPKMQLSRMDDVAGCRLIFSSIAELYAFRESFHKARFNHTPKNTIDKYDYIKHPKKTGYRGVHDVYEYDVNSDAGRSLKGLMVEIQYRTKIQHAWATAVEVIGLITKNQPKFEEGDKRYIHIMALASDILARAFENSKGPFPCMKNKDVVNEFNSLDKELGLLNILRGINTYDPKSYPNTNAILIFSELGDLKIITFRHSPEALRKLFELERDFPDQDMVLVKAADWSDIRFAFRNYFSDAQEFISLIKNGCDKISG